jgi:hypothetical protein
MTSTQVRKSSIVAAAGMAVLVTTVFATLRGSGPESIIRRYHASLQAKDWNAMQRVVAQPVESQSNAILAARVERLVQSGARYRILDVQRGEGIIKAEVEYQVAEVRIPTFWYVIRQQGVWRIDTDQTVFGIRRRLLP